MPLHLLGKKSWNVYNADNIARVRRDEAAAKAAEEEEERRMQEVDAQRRLAILRGESPPPIEDERDAEPEKTQGAPGSARSRFPGQGRKRKRPGEDDTEFELRLAQERNNATYSVVESSRKPASSAPIVDSAGHIDLFGDERARAHAERNEEAEAEKKKKEKEYEDQYTMRFSNAAGRDGISKPWYSQREGVAPDASSKDVWGNNDPDRKTRDTQRINSNDPLARETRNSDNCVKKNIATDMGTDIEGEKGEKEEIIQIPEGVIQVEGGIKIGTRRDVSVTMITVRGDGTRKRSGEGGMETRAHAPRTGGDTGTGAMKDEKWIMNFVL
ncbi:hypothetical protein T069G_05906 [Trichoderma breve]|uniref:CBF1-interacting co-repressor CIR N-terminal domain-containing protein n=1 Tax=Trichoderma breve TaxID=2034170 RepID=A0A9W9BCV0_9HYPO|nr:hypothetical protein T069G_05906 [Trichoderma breve]KAJ4860918.1 hypothetical protein T069G_05906 [Trichoderma breve]